MPRRQPPQLPVCWLMTDPRLTHLSRAMAALPPRSAVIVRHDHLPPAARHRLFQTIRRQVRARKGVVLLAGEVPTAVRWGADGVHLRGCAVRQAALARQCGLIVSAPVHDRRQAARASRAGADAALISPLFATRSHPGAPGIGKAGFARLAARVAPVGAVALGGMTAARFRSLRTFGAKGWAAIDAWM